MKLKGVPDDRQCIPIWSQTNLKPQNNDTSQTKQLEYKI